LSDSIKNTNSPKLVIHGDNADKKLTKVVWSLLSGQDIKIIGTSAPEELRAVAHEAVLIIVNITGGDDPACALAEELTGNPDIIGPLAAFTADDSAQTRLRLFASGFDNIFNAEFIDYPDFRKVLLGRIQKGRRRLSDRIQQEEYALFRAALAASPDAFIVFDDARKLFFVSEHYLRAYQDKAHLLVRGLDVMEAFDILSEITGVTKEDPRYMRLRYFWEKLDGTEEFTLDERRTWRMCATRLAGGKGGTIVTTTDITNYAVQQRELEEKSSELSGALDKEREASAIQKQFINMVSHEFRTPLTIIDGNAQIIQKRWDTLAEEQRQKKLRTIRSAVSRLINMMEGVLSSNMLRTGKLEIIPEKLDLAQLIYDIAEEQRELTSNVVIEYVLDNLPEQLSFDKRVVSLVVSNLISNAIKFSPRGPEIRIKGWIEGGTILVRVADNGIGIPEKELGHVFERYYRATTSSGIPGTGIGLSLVKDLVELHGGGIEVKSKQGQGTSITFWLPHREERLQAAQRE
jgi:signal transduction histidine kinase